MSAFDARYAEAAPRLLEALGTEADVSYTPSGGAASVKAILWVEGEGEYRDVGDGRVYERWGTATVFEAEVGSPGRGDQFVFGGETWVFRSKVKVVGTGHRMIFVVKENEGLGGHVRKG